jgi:PKHD-type hydroxylase
MLLELPDLLDAAGLARAQHLLRDAAWDDGALSAGAQARALKYNQ